LYYPIDTANIGKDRRSLYDVLTKAMKDGKLLKYILIVISTRKRLLKDIEASLNRIDTTDPGREQFNAGIPILDPQYIVSTDLGAH
jgi:hypothetical protein